MSARGPIWQFSPQTENLPISDLRAALLGLLHFIRSRSQGCALG